MIRNLAGYLAGAATFAYVLAQANVQPNVEAIDSTRPAMAASVLRSGTVPVLASPGFVDEKTSARSSCRIVGRSFTGQATSPFERPAGPEIAVDPIIVPDSAPIQHGIGDRYFDNERDIYGYAPRFMPGEVNFDCENRPWIRTTGLVVSGTTTRFDDGAASYIQTLDNNGRWVAYRIEDILNGANLDGLNFGVPLGEIKKDNYSSTTRILSDRDGNTYTVVIRKSAGQYLLFLPHDSEIWQVYKTEPASFHLESTDEYAEESSPPLLVSRNNLRIGFVRHVEGADGILRLDVGRVEDLGSGHAAGSPATPNPQHSGAGPATLSKGDWVYLAYATGENPSGTPQGTPQYFRSYNKVSGWLSAPLLLGYGQNPYTLNPDVHNGPSLIADDAGRLIFLTGAHQDIFSIRTTTAPVEAFEPASGVDPAASGAVAWTAARSIYHKRRWDAGLTYIGVLNARNSDDWYLATRDLSKRDGTMRRTLAFYRSGMELGDIVKPAWPGYSIFYHRLTQDRLGRLYLSYFYYADGLKPPYDEAYARKWPETVQTGQKAHDPVVLMSENGGASWRIATTALLKEGLRPVPAVQIVP